MGIYMKGVPGLMMTDGLNTDGGWNPGSQVKFLLKSNKVKVLPAMG